MYVSSGYDPSHLYEEIRNNKYNDGSNIEYLNDNIFTVHYFHAY